MNLTKIAQALLEMTQEMKEVKRNKSGSINENSAHAIRRRAADKIMAAGEDRSSAWDMANLHRRNFK